MRATRRRKACCPVRTCSHIHTCTHTIRRYINNTTKCNSIIRFVCVGVCAAEMTASHFGGGGGLLRKKTSEEEAKNKTRQELIEELILKSKQEKVKNTAAKPVTC